MLVNENEGGSHTFDGGIFGGTGDEDHAVPKAELEAAVQAVRRIKWKDKGGLTIFFDCNNVVNGFKARRWELQDPGAHKKRWCELGRLLEGRDEVKVV